MEAGKQREIFNDNEDSIDIVLKKRKKFIAKLKNVLSNLFQINEYLVDKGIHPVVENEDLDITEEPEEDSYSEGSVHKHTLVIQNIKCDTCSQREMERRRQVYEANLSLLERLLEAQEKPLTMMVTGRSLSLPCLSLPLSHRSQHAATDHMFAQTFSATLTDSQHHPDILRPGTQDTSWLIMFTLQKTYILGKGRVRKKIQCLYDPSQACVSGGGPTD